MSSKQFLSNQSDRMDSFQVDFFGSKVTTPKVQLILTVFKKVGNKLWSFITLEEILSLSVCSKSLAGLIISKDLVEGYLRGHPRVGFLGQFALSFSTDVTFGILRRILHRLTSGTQGLLNIDVQSGRVIMDIGSAFNDQDAFLSTAIPLDDDDSSSVADAVIQKHLEIASYDEYDDFAPRHPLPREKTHRRGDSYFNSDVEYAASEALIAPPIAGMENMDLAEITAQAVAMELSAAPAPDRRKLQSANSISMTSQNLQKCALDALGDADDK
jgi:hypothetical protein